MSMTREEVGLALARVLDLERESHRRADIFTRATAEDAAYFAVPADVVPGHVRTAAEATRTMSVVHLGLRRSPEIRWFLPWATTPQSRPAFRAGEHTVGLADGKQWLIWVHADLDLDTSVRTTAHEVKHLASRDRARRTIRSRCGRTTRPTRSPSRTRSWPSTASRCSRN